MIPIKGTNFAYEYEIRGGEQVVAVYENGEPVTTLVGSTAQSPLNVAMAYINSPKPIEEKRYTGDEVTNILRSKGYIDETKTFSPDMPIAATVDTVK